MRDLLLSLLSPLRAFLSKTNIQHHRIREGEYAAKEIVSCDGTEGTPSVTEFSLISEKTALNEESYRKLLSDKSDEDGTYRFSRSLCRNEEEDVYYSVSVRIVRNGLEYISEELNCGGSGEEKFLYGCPQVHYGLYEILSIWSYHPPYDYLSAELTIDEGESDEEMTARLSVDGADFGREEFRVTLIYIRK